MKPVHVIRPRPWIRRDLCRHICRGTTNSTECRVSHVPGAYPTIRAAVTRDAYDEHDIEPQTVLVRLMPGQLWIGLPGHPTAYDADGWRVLLEYHDHAEQGSLDCLDPRVPGWDCHVWGDPSDEDAQRIDVGTMEPDERTDSR